MKGYAISLTFLVLSVHGSALAEVLQVPRDSGTIQGAIDQARNGDEILVAPGLYNEAINFHGKAITLRSNDGPEATTIDATGLNTSVVTCTSGEGPGTVLDGFTISGGTGTGRPGAFFGGGMHNVKASPTVRNCVFTGNSANHGGGMFNQESEVTVTDCRFINNTALQFGGGMQTRFFSAATLTRCDFIDNTAARGGGLYESQFVDSIIVNCQFISNFAGARGGGMAQDTDSQPIIANCLFIGNTAQQFGGAIHNSGLNPAIPMIVNCTFSQNQANQIGTSIYNSNLSTAIVSNCILWGEIGPMFGGPGPASTIAYSNVQGGFPGRGNIDVDPLFADPTNGDFRLLAGSPCIDVGSNTEVPAGDFSDLDGNDRIVDGDFNGRAVVDMGPYEWQPPCGDLNEDGQVDLVDLNIFMSVYGTAFGDPGFNPAADFSGDGVVGLADYGIWYECYVNFNGGAP